MSTLLDKLYPLLIDEKIDKFVMAINAPWGYGKTHIAKELINRMSKDNSVQLTLPVLIDLSDYDYVNDPFIPFVVEILNSIEKYQYIPNEKKQALKNVIKEVAISGTKILASFDPSGIGTKVFDVLLNARDKLDSENISGLDDALFDYKSYSELMIQLSNSIEKLKSLDAQATFKRVVVFVDNFDRVEPKFVFKFLNLIDKITAQNITFCLLMNKAQLEKNIYNTILSDPTSHNEHFLNKYVDFEYYLPLIHKRLEELKDILREELHKHIELNKKVMLGMSIRQILDIQKLYLDAQKKIQRDTGTYVESATFILTCFIIVTKDIVIQLHYGFMSSANVSCSSQSGQLLKVIFDIYFNSSPTIVNDPITGNKSYSLTNETIPFNVELQEIYRNIIQIILKEI